MTFVLPNVTNDYFRILEFVKLELRVTENFDDRCRTTSRFRRESPYEELSETARQQLKIRILDALGCAIGALEAEPLRSFARTSPNSMPTANAHCWPEDGQVLNMRHFTMAPPSVTWTSTTVIWQRAKPAILATIWRPFWQQPSSRRKRPGLDDGPRGRLPGAVPVERCGPRPRSRVRSHCTRSLCRCCGSRTRVGSRCLQAANAIAISGTALNALRVTRTGKLSHWKGLAYPIWPLAQLPSSSWLAGHHRSVRSDRGGEGADGCNHRPV